MTPESITASLNIKTHSDAYQFFDELQKITVNLSCRFVCVASFRFVCRSPCVWLLAVLSLDYAMHATIYYSHAKPNSHHTLNLIYCCIIESEYALMYYFPGKLFKWHNTHSRATACTTKQMKNWCWRWRPETMLIIIWWDCNHYLCQMTSQHRNKWHQPNEKLLWAKFMS